MGLTPESGALMLGIVVVLLNVLTLLYGIWEQRVPVVRVGTVFILLMVYALVWKHSFIRADGHVLALFSIAPMLSIYGVEFLKLPVWWRSTYILTIIFSGTAIFLVNPGMISNPIDLISQNLKSQIGGGHSFNEAKESGMGCNQKMQELHNALGDSMVDVISYEQGDAINAGLNYRCRPVPQSYSAYTPLLLEKNADFYRSLSSPDAVLFKLQTIDARVPMMDDSLVLKELLLHYRYSREVGGFALFTKIKPQTCSATEKPLFVDFNKEVHLWEDIPLPISSGAIWIKINARLSWIGRIRSMFFQTPNLCIAVKDTMGTEDHFRVVPEMAKTGFLLSPWITSTKEFVTYSQTGTGRTVQSIRIQPLSLGEDRLWKSLEIVVLNSKNLVSAKKKL